MIGYILLGFAIYYYFYAGMKKWSILIFMFFCNDGFWILPDYVIGAKNYDLAAIFCFFMAPFSMIYEDAPERENKTIKYIVVFLMYFMIVSAFFSRYHYDFTWFQIFQGGRRLIIFVSYFFIVKMKKKDIEWLFNILFKITIITSVLFIIQVLTDLPVLPKSAQIIYESGLNRYYNCPPLIYLFLYVSIFHPTLIKIRHQNISTIILAGALLCTLGRIEIFSAFLMILIGFLMRGRLTNFLKYVLILAIAMIPVLDTITSRLSGDDTSDLSTGNEIAEIFNGSIQETVNSGKYRGQGTLNYRLAWVYERMLYLNTRPIGEKIFGFGLINDGQTEIVQRMYNFRIARPFDLSRKEMAQLETPDISYGNMLTRFGYVGGLALFILWVYIAIYGWKKRKDDEWMFILFLLVTGYIIRSFSGDVISNPKYLSMLYLIITLSLFRQAEKEQSGVNVDIEKPKSSETEKTGTSLETEVSIADENHSH